ncbi:MAG: hypothetical protein ACRDE5_05915, partial [Ginsengibacter sp.]
MFSLKKKSCFITILIGFILFGAACIVPLISNAQKDSTAFGDTTFITNGLMGKIFLLPVTTRKLPDFDTMKPVSTIYT